jgi:hypothetical protein
MSVLSVRPVRPVRPRIFVLLSLVCVCVFSLTASAQGEVLVRWDQDQIPSRDALGLSTVVVPAKNRAAVQHALAQGYRVFLEVDAAAVASFVPPAGAVAGVLVKGKVSSAQLAQLAQLTLRLKPRGIIVRTLEERGKWPHVRSNWVTNTNGMLQVSSRTAQPWVENNAALVRIAQVTQPGSTPLLIYPWQPITASEIDEGPATEDYLVAIAEAGSVGADLVLPLHERFEKSLLLGIPTARAGWTAIRKAILFYAWDLPERFQRTANIGVVTADAMRWFEVMNLLARHNLSFDLLPKEKFAARDVSAFDLLIVLDQPSPKELDILTAFARNGGTVVLGAGLTGSPSWHTAAPIAKTAQQVIYAVGAGGGGVVEMLQPIANPDEFALAMRQLLGREKRVIEIWNGITVLAAHYAGPDHETVMLTMVNYAHQEMPVQLRIAGKFSAVRYESPDDQPALLPYQQRDGFTEFVVPALRVGGRLFLTKDRAKE